MRPVRRWRSIMTLKSSPLPAPPAPVNANIVFADCPDLQKAVNAAAGGIFYNQGQVCIAGTRLLLEESIADRFLDLLKEQAKGWQPGNPLDPNTTMGMLIDNSHADSLRPQPGGDLRPGAGGDPL